MPQFPMPRDDFGTYDTPSAQDERQANEAPGFGEVIGSMAGRTTGDIYRFAKHKLNSNPDAQNLESPDDLNKQYGLEGSNRFTKWTRADIAQEMVTAMRQKQRADDMFARFSQQHSWPVNMATGMIGSMLDPVEASATMIPGVGEERLAYKLAQAGWGAKTSIVAGKLTEGATAGMLGTAALQPLRAMMAPDELQEWHIRDAMAEMLYAAPFGAIMHAGLTPAIGAGVSKAFGGEVHPYFHDYYTNPQLAAGPSPINLTVDDLKAAVVRGAARGSYDEHQAPTVGRLRELADMNTYDRYLQQKVAISQILTGHEVDNTTLHEDLSAEARKILPAEHDEWDRLDAERKQLAADHLWGVQPTAEQLNDPAWRLEQELREHTKGILPVSWDLRVAAGENPTSAAAAAVDAKAPAIEKYKINPREASSESIAAAKEEIDRLYAEDERYKEAKKSPSSLNASEASYQKTIRDSAIERSERISRKVEDLHKIQNEHLDKLRAEKDELGRKSREADNDTDRRYFDDEKVKKEDEIYHAMFSSEYLKSIEVLEDLLRYVQKEIDLVAHAETASPVDVSQAKKIEDIGIEDPHPGKVLAYHGTSSDAFFQKMIVKPHAHIGLHFGTVEQATTFTAANDYLPRDVASLDSIIRNSGGVSRIYPVVLDLKKVVTMDDQGGWEPRASFYNLEGKIDKEIYDKYQEKIDRIYGQIRGYDEYTAKHNYLKEQYEKDAISNHLMNKIMYDYNGDINGLLTTLRTKLKVELDQATRDEQEIRMLEYQIRQVAKHVGEFEAISNTYADLGGMDWNERTAEGQQLIRDMLTEAGYDGVRYRNTAEGEGWSYIVWQPGSVKSAISGLEMFNLGEKGVIRGMTDPAKRTAWISAMAVDPKLVAREESGHAIKASGLFKPEEWGILRDAAINHDWLSDIPKDIRDHYAKDYALRGPDGVRDAMIEEAIMHRFAKGPEAWGEPGGPLARLMQRIRELLERIGNWLTSRGFQSANDVFRAMEEGKISSMDTMEPHAARRLGEISNRMAELEPKLVDAYKQAKDAYQPDIPSIAEAKRSAWIDGSAPAMTRHDLQQAVMQIYGPREEIKLTPAKFGETPVELQMQEQMHQKLLAEGYRPLTDEIKELDETERAVKESLMTEAGYAQAGECLMMAGL